MHACKSFRIHTHTHTLIIMLFSLPSLGLEYSEGQKDPEGEILSVHWTCNLELSSSLCQAFVFTLLSQNWKPISSLVQPDWVILWQTHLVQCATNIAHTFKDCWCFFFLSPSPVLTLMNWHDSLGMLNNKYQLSSYYLYSLWLFTSKI